MTQQIQQYYEDATLYGGKRGPTIKARGNTVEIDHNPSNPNEPPQLITRSAIAQTDTSLRPGMVIKRGIPGLAFLGVGAWIAYGVLETGFQGPASVLSSIFLFLLLEAIFCGFGLYFIYETLTTSNLHIKFTGGGKTPIALDMPFNDERLTVFRRKLIATHDLSEATE